MSIDGRVCFVYSVLCMAFLDMGGDHGGRALPVASALRDSRAGWVGGAFSRCVVATHILLLLFKTSAGVLCANEGGEEDEACGEGDKRQADIKSDESQFQSRFATRRSLSSIRCVTVSHVLRARRLLHFRAARVQPFWKC